MWTQKTGKTNGLFRDNRGLGELISRSRVGIEAPRDNGALGEFISRPRMGRDLWSKFGLHC